MCWCRPEVRTPFCGRPECHDPLRPETPTVSAPRDDSDPVGDVAQLIARVDALEEVVALLLQTAQEDTVDEIEDATRRFKLGLEVKRRALGLDLTGRRRKT